MTRDELIRRISDAYAIDPDYPWDTSPEAAVFRHPHNRKWFGLLMRVRKNLLSLPGEGLTDILNIKCDPLIVGALKNQPGYLPAYHMNKSQWISIVLDRVSDEDIMSLVDMSYCATQKPITLQ